jgi:YVTN family beta-propeller protein
MLTASACSAPSKPPVSAKATEMVFFRTDQGIVVSDGKGKVQSSDAALASPDWSRLYAVRGTDLVAFEPATNRELSRAALPGRLIPRAVSYSGTHVALTQGAFVRPDPPVGRKQTTIVVTNPNGSKPPIELKLKGNFEPEAFSVDDTHLFVQEYLPAEAPDRYRVRRVELATEKVMPLNLRDKSLVPPGAEEEMRGEGRQSVLSPDRTRLYTLYLHQGDHKHTRDLLPARKSSGGPDVHAFVHVLSLTDGWAYCLDLPAPYGTNPADTYALTIAPDGKTLYVGDMTAKKVVVADTENLKVTKVVSLGNEYATGQGTSMSISPDGKSLYIGTSKVVLDLNAAAMRVDRAWSQPAQVHGLALDPAGRQLFVGQPGGITRVDASTGDPLGTFTTTGLETLLHSTRP